MLRHTQHSYGLQNKPWISADYTGWSERKNPHNAGFFNGWRRQNLRRYPYKFPFGLHVMPETAVAGGVQSDVFIGEIHLYRTLPLTR